MKIKYKRREIDIRGIVGKVKYGEKKESGIRGKRMESGICGKKGM